MMRSTLAPCRPLPAGGKVGMVEPSAAALVPRRCGLLLAAVFSLILT